MTDQSLSLLQHWMKTVVTERGSLTEKLLSASQQCGLGIEDVVAETRGLSAHTRLSIYTSGYVLRLLECMRADFPALRAFVGAAVFDAFAKAYIVSEPPKSPSLFDLGARFPQFLERTKPKGNPLDVELVPLLDLPPEIARFERARVEVMRASGTEHDPPATRSFHPLGIFNEGITLQTTPCLRLLQLKFPLVEFLKKLDQGERPAPPTPVISFVAISRSHYRIHSNEISAWQFAFLEACQQPISLYLAAQRGAQQSGMARATVLAQLVMWLPVAMESGFLRQVS